MTSFVMIDVKAKKIVFFVFFFLFLHVFKTVQWYSSFVFISFLYIRIRNTTHLLNPSLLSIQRILVEIHDDRGDDD